MMKRLSSLRGVVAAAAMLLTLALGSARALADKVTLKNGTVVQGTIVREADGAVWIKVASGGIDDTKFYTKDEIKAVDKDGGSAPAPTKAPTPAATPSEPAAAPVAAAAEPAAMPHKTGVPRIAVITLGEGHDKDMVGVFMTAEALKRAVPVLKSEGVTDVVFRINSGGGYLFEIQKLSDEIHNEYKKEFRTVAWIESAISAAAMTAHCIEEIYFLEKGNYGACTGWSGALVAVKGRQLEESLYMMEKISARGKKDPQIMRAMQIMEPLSCTIDEKTGDVTWYQNLDGDYVVNPKERILTFNSTDALKYKFSKGTTDDINELAKLMGYTEYELVGKQVPGVPYPVCKAEQDQRNFRNQTAKDQDLTRAYFLEYNGSVNMARGAPMADRGKFVGKAKQALDQIKRMVKNNPAFSFLLFGVMPDKFKDWVAEQEEMLRQLMKK